VVFLTTWQGGHRPRHSYFRTIVLFVCAQERSRGRGPDPNWVTSHDDLSRCRKRRREGVGRTKIGGRGSSRSDRAEPGVRPVRDAGCGTWAAPRSGRQLRGSNRPLPGGGKRGRHWYRPFV